MTYLNAVYVTHFGVGTSSANAFITATRAPAFSGPHAGLPDKRNIVSNARPHIGKGLVLRIDIEDFFPSITENRIRTLFRNTPFSFPEQLIDFLCQVIIYEGVLPVGSPTSPILSNLVLDGLDQQFRAIEHLTYTRYADDFTFSTDYYSASNIQPVVNRLISTIEEEGFRVNKQKLTVAKSTQRQAVTGIIVNSKPNVQRTYIRYIRAILHSIATKGWKEAANIYVYKYQSKYLSSIGRYFYTACQYRISDEVLRYYCIGGPIWYLQNSLRGRIEHIGYVKGKADEVYNKLKSQFLALARKDGFAADTIAPELADPGELAYITNATANSVVYYAYTFLKNSGYNDSRIAELRNAFSLNKTVNFKGMLRSLEKESAYFINLYAYMLEENKFTAFTTRLNDDSFKRLFKFNENVYSLIQAFGRRIFHTTQECSAARNDYNDGIKHEANTGIFFDGRDESKVVYIIRRPFLQKLGMRICQKCE